MGNPHSQPLFQETNLRRFRTFGFFDFRTISKHDHGRGHDGQLYAFESNGFRECLECSLLSEADIQGEQFHWKLFTQRLPLA